VFVRKLVDSLETNVDQAETNDFVSTDLEVLLSELNSSQGLRWRLDTLNKSLGSLRKGDFGFVVKRPETGGTTFLANQVGYILSDIPDSVVLWINNEEQGEKVVIRVFQSFFNTTYKELIVNAPSYNEKFHETVGERFRFYDNTIASNKDVERLCEQVKPNLIIFDQIDKIKGFTDEREDLRLGNIYIWARELAKQYCPIIAVTQASGEAEGKKYLTMDMIANSKTAKAAEADWILGIGMSHNDGEEYTRYLSIMKNKLLGDADSKPELRHGKMPVTILPEVARFEDAIKWN
jgi:replicative DNA helicase